MEIDDAIAVVGGYKRFNLAAFFIISLSSLLATASQVLIIVFIGRPSPHHCRLAEGVSPNTSIPIDVATGDLAQCSMYVNNSWSNETTSCVDGWTYNNYDGEQTIVMEWDLVCKDSHLPDMAQVFYMIGAMVGEIIGAMLADRFGRRWVHVSCYVVIVLVGTGVGFTQTYLAFALLRPIVAVATAATLMVGETHMFELFDSRRRAAVGIGLEYIWVGGYMYMALLAWLVQDWRQLQIILSLSSLIGLLCAFIPESPPWLLANNKRDEAEEVLQKMARYNGVKLTSPLLMQAGAVDPLLGKHNNSEIHMENLSKPYSTQNGTMCHADGPPEETGHETVIDLVRWPLLRKYTIISTLLWFANNIVYLYIVLNTPSLAGSLYLNFVIGGLVEIPANFVAYIVVKRSRRISTCVFHTFAAAALIALAFIPKKTTSGVDLSILIVTTAMIGRFSIAVSFAIIILFTKEYFPTNLRATSGAVCNFLGRIGSIAAPFASLAAKSVPWVPNLVLGVISLAVAMVTLLLPETKDWPLPQSIADVYRYSRGEHRNRKTSIAKELH